MIPLRRLRRVKHETSMAPHHHKHHRKHVFDRFSTTVTRATGSSYAFLIATLIVVLWAVTGPVFDYSNSWQLVINTGTTIITFLMVFVIQQSQNKDTLAIQLKLNELIASDSAANNRLVDIEDLSAEELAVLKKFYLSGQSARGVVPTGSRISDSGLRAEAARCV